ncbi:Uncharacterised protein [Nocardia brasiliensis]|nr:Uncharacterised protein [Nocardia brasiliensis]
METSVRAPSRPPRLDFARTDPSVRRAGSLVPSARVSPPLVAPAVHSRTGSVFSHGLCRGVVGARAQKGCGILCGVPICRLGCSRCWRGAVVPSPRAGALVVDSRTGSAASHRLWRGGVGAGAQNGCGILCGVPICRLGCSRCWREGVVSSPRSGALVVDSRTGSVFSHGLWRGVVGARAQNGCGNRGLRRGADALLGRGVQRPAAGFRWSSSRHVMSRGAIPGWVFRAHSGRSFRPDPGRNSCYRPCGGDLPTGCVAAVIEAGQPGLDEGCQRVAKGYVLPWHRADASRIRCEVPAVVSDRRCAGRGLRRKVGQPAQKSLSSRVRAYMSVERMACVPRSAAEPTRPA